MSPLCVSCERDHRCLRSERSERLETTLPRVTGHAQVERAPWSHERPARPREQPAHPAAPARPRSPCAASGPDAAAGGRVGGAAAQGAVRGPALVVPGGDRGRARVGDHRRSRWRRPRQCGATTRTSTGDRASASTAADRCPHQACSGGGTGRSTGRTTEVPGCASAARASATPTPAPDPAHPGEADAHALTTPSAWSARARRGEWPGCAHPLPSRPAGLRAS